MNYVSSESVLVAQLDAAVTTQVADVRRGQWAVVLDARIFPDRDQWCALLGTDLMTGVCGFGKTPEEAIEAFELAMRHTPPPQARGGETP